MDQERFLAARDHILHEHPRSGGIGVLGEKSLHAILKRYLEPCTNRHEVKLGPYVADIVGEQGIVEIQTRGFHRLKKKLDFFLESAGVTVVYPVSEIKWLIWLDPETGEVVSRRKSPKKGTRYDIFHELLWIRDSLAHPNLRLHLLFLETEDYRFLNGWNYNRKKGSTRYERIPLSLLGELHITCPPELNKLIPPDLPEEFLIKDFAKAARLSPKAAQRGVQVLFQSGVIIRSGKKGNAYMYRVRRQDDNTPPTKL